jgi:SAM-dependent methyltransferase
MTAFDSLAPTYDSDFTKSPIARYLRARIQARLDLLAAPGERVLELGCGTGEDALHLARRGVHVLATDASDAMLREARAKLTGFDHVRVAKLDIRHLPDVETFRNTAGHPFTLAFANFGVLNCLEDTQPLGHWLARLIPPGGHIAFAVMPPMCLWEIAWHGLHGEWQVAGRRWRYGGSRFRGSLTVRYPTVARFTRSFFPWFRRIHLEPLGLFLPPSDVYGVIEHRPRWQRALMWLDSRAGRMPMLANFADHFWVEFERSNAEPLQR